MGVQAGDGEGADQVRDDAAACHRIEKGLEQERDPDHHVDCPRRGRAGRRRCRCLELLASDEVMAAEARRDALEDR